MNIEKKKTFITNTIYIFILLFLLFLSLKYALPVLMPFIIGFIVAMILKPVIRFIHKKTNINKKLISVLIFLLFYGTIGLLLAFLIISTTSSLKELFIQLPDIYASSIEPSLVIIFEWFEKALPHVTSILGTNAENIIQSLTSFVTSFSSGALNLIKNFATQIPMFVVKVLLGFLSSFFFTIDYDKVTSFILRQMSPSNQKVVLTIMHNCIRTVFKFIRAYAILISITFIELTIGFSLLNIDNVLLLAFLIALIDVLPVIGTGTILIPWVIISFVQKNIGFAVGMLVLYLVVWCVRQFLEPKIVGEQIGLHPIVTLISMFIGVTFFGFLGLFMLPLIATIVKKLNDDGTIHLLK